MPTEQQWNKIRDEKQISIQAQACVNKAVDLTIAKGIDKKSYQEVREEIENWVNILFEIGSEKKEKELTPQPVSDKAAQLSNEDFEKRMEQDKTEAEIDEANRQAAEVAAMEQKNKLPTIEQ